MTRLEPDYTLSRRMGMSVKMIDETYGHSRGTLRIRSASCSTAYDLALDEADRERASATG